MPRQCRHERRQDPVLHDARTQAIFYLDVSGTNRADQPGDPQTAGSGDLQRIAGEAVDLAQQQIDPLQTIKRLEEQALVTHREIARLGQRVSKIARKIGMAEIGGVVGAVCQHDDPTILPAALFDQVVAQSLEIADQPLSP